MEIEFKVSLNGKLVPEKNVQTFYKKYSAQFSSSEWKYLEKSDKYFRLKSEMGDWKYGDPLSNLPLSNNVPRIRHEGQFWCENSGELEPSGYLSWCRHMAAGISLYRTKDPNFELRKSVIYYTIKEKTYVNGIEQNIEHEKEIDEKTALAIEKKLLSSEYRTFFDKRKSGLEMSFVDDVNKINYNVEIERVYSLATKKEVFFLEIEGVTTKDKIDAGTQNFIIKELKAMCNDLRVQFVPETLSWLQLLGIAK